METMLNYTRWGAVLAGLAVALGAFAAHGLEGHFRTRYAGRVFEKTVATPEGRQVVETVPLDKKYLADFETGVRYQMYHALALLGLGLVPVRNNRSWLRWAAAAFLAGIAGFSGGLYLYSLFALRWVGMLVVPLGGTLFLVGWVCLVVAVERARKAGPSA
ncbi:MAG: DUF423 domain-containing protein [Planctomycetaceae bacterium]